MTESFNPQIAVDLAARLTKARASVEMANNGYADIGTREDLADAMQAHGYTVITTKNLFGMPTYRAFTAAAQAALKAEPFGVATYKPPSQTLYAEDFGFDFEAAILARHERHLFA